MTLKPCTVGTVQNVAWHEASHGVVAVALLPSGSVESLEVAWRSDSLGALAFTPATINRIADGAWLGADVQIALAGLVGESMHRCGTKINPDAPFDFDERDGGDLDRARMSAGRLTKTKAERDDLLRRSAATVYGILTRRWQAVEAVAAHLLANLTMSGSMLESLCRRHRNRSTSNSF